ncbi:CpsD/CapB family tyrosine-protein kinase [Pseudokineococcus lusitanus]|uniref:Mrp family chromosome partitioning ATPase n=1 Tax=Pseudokineococcus lusitanus TaxID=763993 RepID=A0A3N1HL03_9ACTN|nr:CpsD/CapB family tyrosine-protein kinase [Pseudokineococcus lusitanus]ROP43012.1 Mrp family chromosome partitioning ATPase [Pseudokineococcus lusitanus]
MDTTAPTLIGALWRYRWSSALLVLLVAALSVAAGSVSGPAATVSASISLTPPGPDNVLAPGTQGDASSARYTAQRAAFVTSDAVLTAVADRTGRDNLTELRREVVAEPALTSSTVTVTVESSDAEEAVALASAVVDSYAEQTQAQVDQLTQEALDSLAASEQEVIDSTDVVLPVEEAQQGSVAATLADLRLQASEIRTSSALFGDGVSFVEAPRLDAVVTRGLPLREAFLGVVVGLVAAGLLAWVRADRHRRLSSPDELEPDASFLGELRRPGDLDVPAPGEPLEMPTQSHRLVGAVVGRETSGGVLAVTSADERLRTATALNLAASLARDGRRVLVVDGDTDHHALTSRLALDGTPWTAALADGGRAPVPTLLRTTGGGELQVVGAAPDATAAPGGRSVEELVRGWRRDHDAVVVDLPALGGGQLVTDLAAAADAGLLVVAHGADDRGTRDELRRWAALGTPLVGYVYARASARGRGGALGALRRSADREARTA